MTIGAGAGGAPHRRFENDSPFENESFGKCQAPPPYAPTGEGERPVSRRGRRTGGVRGAGRSIGRSGAALENGLNQLKGVVAGVESTCGVVAAPAGGGPLAANQPPKKPRGEWGGEAGDFFARLLPAC